MTFLAKCRTADRELWLKERQSGLGGSDAGTILGVNKWKTADHLLREKAGLVEPREAGSSARWGNHLEPAVAAFYAEEHQIALVHWPFMFRHPEYEFMLYTPDYVEVEVTDLFPAGTVTEWPFDKVPDGIIGITEIKTTGIASRGDKRAWGTDENPLIPPSYDAQGLHGAAVTGKLKHTFACLCPPHGLIVRHRTYTEAEIDALIEAESVFWDEVVAARNAQW